MNRVLRIDEKLQRLDKPALSSHFQVSLGRRDLLILCGGFEDRAVAFLNHALEHSKSSFSALLIDYLPAIKENRTGEIRTTCRKNKIKLQEYVYDRQDPSGSGDDIRKLVGNEWERIFLDISGMSRLLIVQLIVSMQDLFKSVHVIYTEAQEYPPEKTQVEAEIQKRETNSNTTVMFLSSGVFGVSIIPELSSVAMQNQPLRLIVFPSFNCDQLIRMRAELQPSYFSVIHGRPPEDRYAWRLEAIKRINLITELPQCEDYVASTLDYRETLDILLGIYATHGAFQRLLVAPVGSKMQAVAVGIFKTYMDDVQVIYPIPQVFKDPHSYTKGVKEFYSLPLGPFHVES